jgi:hypothetical protein
MGAAVNNRPRALVYSVRLMERNVPAAILNRVIGAVVLVAAFAVAGPGRAEHAPSIVMANPRGAPPIVDGFDATGAIIEGDWGLSRPGTGVVTIYTGPGIFYPAPPPARYFPSTGRRPRYGRDEVIPPANRRLPPPAQSYHRSWTTDAPSRVVVSSPVPYEPPAVITAVPVERFNQRPRKRGPRPRPR